jgi:pimeloyl-ACP methyl ester carboxylesterase
LSVHIRRGRRWLTIAVASAAIVGPIGATVAPAGAVTTPAARAISSDRTSKVEARRVGSVPTPKLGWYDCYDGAQCATALLPLDYDQPHGAKTEVSLLRRQARDKAHRIGSLFVNPGGPGGSGTQMALFSPFFLSPGLVDRFDVVGFDPRGTNFSDQVKCFPGNAQQTTAMKGMLSNAFPLTKAEERAAIASAKSIGKGCSSTGRPLSASMSTAEVARDMDVLRRAVGDRKLTYLGFSYGSYLGQVYANMFPDRVRAVTIDGVLDPIAWAGTPATASRPQTDRLRSADGSYKALRRILTLCDRAGGLKCRFSPGNPAANYDLVARRLKKTPLSFPDPFGGPPATFNYAALVANTVGALYSPDGSEFIDFMMSDLIVLTEPPAGAVARPAAAVAARSKMMAGFASRLKTQQARLKRSGFGFPYDNSMEASAAVLCTDGSNPADAASWPAAAAAADRRAKYFGRYWTWLSAQCASKTWTARDEDAYRGPFNRRTASPILVVGNTWDPATNYQGAVKAASLLPNSRLLSSDNWGHTAYGTSRCATSSIDTYLLTKVLPARGTVCHGDVQPFTDLPVSNLQGAAARGQHVPVVPLIAPRK